MFVVSWANSPVVGFLYYPCPPGPAVPPCAAPYRPARGMFGLWNRQVDTNLIVRASEESFRTVVFGTLVCTRDRCIFG